VKLRKSLDYKKRRWLEQKKNVTTCCREIGKEKKPKTRRTIKKANYTTGRIHSRWWKLAAQCTTRFRQ